MTGCSRKLVILTWAFFTLPGDPVTARDWPVQWYNFPDLITCERAAREIEVLSRWRLIASACYPQVERPGREAEPAEKGNG